jgi:hypothetical protein
MAKNPKKVIPRSMSFRICVYPTQFDRSLFTAHCLELDIFGQDRSIEGAVSELLHLIESQLKVCERTGAQLQFFAPASVWQKYEQAKKAKRKLPDELMDRIIREANRRLGFDGQDDIRRRVDYIVGTKEVIEECQAALA